MKIKKFLMLMVAFLVTTAFAACSDSKDNGGGEQCRMVSGDCR